MSYSFFAIYVDDMEEFSKFEEVGYWMGFHIIKIETSLIPRLNLSGKRIINMPEHVAMAWKFAGANRPFIRISGSGSRHLEQLPADKLEPYKPGKVNYYLTDEDIANAIKFMKAIITALAHNYYEQIWLANKPQISMLHELGSAAGISQPLKKNDRYNLALESVLGRLGRTEALLANAKSIADCNEVLKQLQIDVGM